MGVERICRWYWARRATRQRAAGDHAGAFASMARVALAGDVEGQAWVAEAYLQGRGVPSDVTEASRWFGRAAARGHVGAMVTRAKIALQGLLVWDGTGPDFETGVLWARRASEAGSSEAKLILANVYLFGPVGWQDRPAAEALFRAAAAEGIAVGQLGLAFALLQAAPDRAERAESHRLIRAAARQELPMANYLAGVMSEFGIDTPADLATAATQYSRAADAGIRPAQTRLGAALLCGAGIPRDVDAGETWLRKAALAGDGVAAALVADLYGPDGVFSPNFVELSRWLTRAAECGHRRAAVALGQTLAAGLGASPDRIEARRWLARAEKMPTDASADDPARRVSRRCVSPDASLNADRWLQSAISRVDKRSAIHHPNHHAVDEEMPIHRTELV